MTCYSLYKACSDYHNHIADHRILLMYKMRHYPKWPESKQVLYTQTDKENFENPFKTSLKPDTHTLKLTLVKLLLNPYRTLIKPF